mgnify:CR=1 FL=1
MTTIPSPTALFVDLDDTLLAYTASGRNLWPSVIEGFADRLPIEPTVLLKAIAQSSDEYWADPEQKVRGGMRLREARRQVVAGAFVRLGLLTPPWANDLADTFTDTREAAAQLYDGVPEALQRLREGGVRLALITNGNSELQWGKVRRCNLQPYFAAILVSGDLGFGKPDPRVFALALKAVATDAPNAWMVGDDLHLDIAPVRPVGLGAGVWVDFAGRGLPADPPAVPHHTVRTFSEVPALLGL